MSSPVSRGFRRVRRPSAGEQDRVPPGQYVTQDFPTTKTVERTAVRGRLTWQVATAPSPPPAASRSRSR